MQKKNIHFLTQAAMIAALYVVLTFIANAFGLANYAVQVRFSEALTILPIFTTAGIPGLFIGCIISNVLTGCALPDIIFGSIAIDCIHTTASSHGRVFIVEIMGHKVGWLTLHAGIAGGADIILLPEIPYDLDAVVKKIKERTRGGSRFSILAVAEGAISKEEAAMSKKEYKKKLEERAQKYQSVAYEIGAKIQEMTGQEIRVTVPGHMQRGGAPVPFDRVLSSRIGAHAAAMIERGDFGKLVVVKNNVITDIPLEESAGKLKYVDPQSDIIKEAKLLGISFGDK